MIADAGPRGAPQAMLLVQFRLEVVIDLIVAGLALVRTEVIQADDRKVEMPRVRVTDTGRRKLAH